MTNPPLFPRRARPVAIDAPSRPAVRLSRLALHLACAALLPALPAGTALAQTAPSGQAMPTRNIDIPPGRLSAVLGTYAAQAGVHLSADGALTQGLQSEGLKGRYGVAEGFARLLARHGLQAVPNGNGGYTLATLPKANGSGEATLATVTVSARNSVADGSADSGYRTNRVSAVGPWQGRGLQDTPYAISVVTAEQIDNVQAISVDQIFKMNPVVQLSAQQRNNDQPRFILRGFGGYSTSVSARDGIQRGGVNEQGISLEDVERVEVLTGLSGFLYGPGNVGGIVNYVTKRPTKERYNQVSIGNESGANVRVHGDFGGPIDDEGRFGYRINVAHQEGDTLVDDQSFKRDFVSAAFDWHIRPDLLLQVEGSHQDYESKGYNEWYFPPGQAIPDAKSLDPTKQYGQGWTTYKVPAKRVGTSVKWTPSDNLSVRAGWSRQAFERHRVSITPQPDSASTYEIGWGFLIPQTTVVNGGYAYADLSFATGPLKHKLTAGGQWTEIQNDAHVVTGSRGGSLAAGIPLGESAPQIAMPAMPSVGASYKASQGHFTTWLLGDDITFNEQWSALIGISHSAIRSKVFNATGTTTSNYDEQAITPTLSLIYKPLPALTTYVSYIEALEQGGSAASTYGLLPVTNALEVMAPMVSKQMEIGAKATVGDMLLTAALFQINKSLQYYDLSVAGQATYVQDGRQVHKGLELTATGKLTPNLTLLGGLTLLDAKVKEQKQNPALEGKQPVPVSDKLAKVYAEWRVPGMAGLSVNGGVYYTGPAYENALNTRRYPGYTLFDAGLRYETAAFDRLPLTLRLNVTNLADKRYWLSSAALGSPRTVLLSASVRF